MCDYCGILWPNEGQRTSGFSCSKGKRCFLQPGEQENKLVLYTSKTHGRNRLPQEIKITADENRKISSHHSPFELVTLYGQLRGSYDTENEQFFIYRDYTPVKPSHIRRLLRTVLKRIGLNATLYGTHSFENWESYRHVKIRI